MVLVESGAVTAVLITVSAAAGGGKHDEDGAKAGRREKKTH